MKQVLFILCLSLLSASSFAHEGMNPSADYGFGITGGFLTGQGIYVRKYFGDNYVQLGGLASSYVVGDENNSGAYDWNVALVAGRYLNKIYFSRANFPVGFHAFVGVHDTYEKQTKDDYDYAESPIVHYLYAGPGFGVDFLNPATKGYGLWFTVSYVVVFDMVDNANIDSTAFLGSTGMSFNW